jgi:hypothetical protein
MFKIEFQPQALETLGNLKQVNPKKHRKVLNTFISMEKNLRHPSLKTHKYNSLLGPNREEVFESYVENKTPAAFRVFWYYGPERGIITILAITPHP